MRYTDLANMQKQSKNPTLAERRPIRILHVLGSLNRGGIETWLLQILRHIDRDRFQMDFLVHSTQPGDYDDEIRALGSQILTCPHPNRPWIYAPHFRQLLRVHGPYDIVHGHVHHFNGSVLRLAKQAGVSIRIAHSHSDTSSQEASGKWYRYLYLALMKGWIHRYATVGLAISREAAAVLFGLDWETDPRWRVFDCGIDLKPFQDEVDPVAVRTELGIPQDAFVIGHVGRFVEVKNHSFIIDTMVEVAKRDPNICLLLVGDGPLRSSIEQKAFQVGLTERVIFAGIRTDIPRLMLGAMNVFLFPSLYEGMGHVRLEAQAAGLPSVVSDQVPEEGDVVKPLVRRMSLSQSASTWAETILATREAKPEVTRAEAFKLLEQSRFNIWNSVKNMQTIYLNLCLKV
jgi:glycosyltransferase involved in cell wall biosynthesis